MLTTNQKGCVAEMAIAHEAAKLGLGVFLPVGDERCDLILDLRPRLLRVQCKWASRHDDVVVVRLYSARRAREGLRRRFYSRDEIDAFAAHCADTGQSYLFGIDDYGTGQHEMRLRLGPTRNNQAKGIRFAKDYEFAACAARLRAIQGP